MKPMVRQAVDSDLDSLLELIKPYLSPGFNWREEMFRHEFAYTQTWLIHEREQVLAFCCLRDAVEAWEISVLATHTDFRKKGHMQALLYEVFQRVGRERHYWLEVHESNVSAQRLYEKIGFQREGARGGYYTDGSTAFLYTLPKQG
jgi:[ribosomal protein S18]-alanine N-acetyltransferase